jgi:hypothetical protein
MKESDIKDEIKELKDKFHNKIDIQNKVIKTLIDNIGKLQLRLDKLEDAKFKFIEDYNK